MYMHMCVRACVKEILCFSKLHRLKSIIFNKVLRLIKVLNLKFISNVKNILAVLLICFFKTFLLSMRL